MSLYRKYEGKYLLTLFRDIENLFEREWGRGVFPIFMLCSSINYRVLSWIKHPL